MRKIIVRMLTVVALVGGTAVVGTTTVASAKADTPVTKLAATPALYSISTIKQTAPPPGCVGTGCPQVEQSVPAYVAATGFATLVGAKKIDTYNTNMGNTSSKGGCAITAESKLACWGSNTYSQLGDGTTTDSETPVQAVGISNIQDAATNGFTTCVVTTAKELKCVGKGSWPGFSKVEIGSSQSTRTLTWSNSSQNYVEVNTNPPWKNECQIQRDGTVVATVANCYDQSSAFSKSWVTVTTGVEKLQMAGSQGWDNSNLCILKSDGTVACAKVLPQKPGDQEQQNTEDFDCNGDGQWDISNVSNSGLPRVDCFNTGLNQWGASTPKWITRWGNRNQTLWPASQWTWVDSTVTGVVDFAMSEQAWGSDGTVCMIAGADKSLVCKPFTGVTTNGDPRTATPVGGVWGKTNTIAGVYNAEKVYMTTFNGQLALCVYAAGTLSCGTASWNGSTMSFPTTVDTIAVMEKPISIFSQQASGMSKAYFMTPSGLLSADSWAFGCSGCMKSSSSILSSVSAFKDATSTNSYFIQEMTGSTDSADFIPVNLVTATRKLLSQKAITVKTSSGAVLSGTDVRWTAPDAPDSLSSSKSAKDTTGTDGTVRLATLPTGPVSFTLRGGTLSDGTYLQAAVVTQVIPDTGAVDVIVPVSSGVIDRTVSVKLTDTTPVPNAVVVLRNNYLTYNYANNGSANSSWSATAPDTKGYMQQASCAYCFVAPPTYITGADGTVTWKSFAPASRSSQYDAEVVYDDGSLNQKVRVNFTGTSADASTAGYVTSVTMPFMANVQTPVASEVAPKSDGSVEIPVTMKDGDNLPISNLDAKAEEVCGEMQKGGLWSGTSSVQEGFCSGTGPGSTNSGSNVKTASVHSFACAAASTAKTDAKGAATIKICPTKSGYYRVRSSGVLPSKSICVKVNNQPCTVTLLNSIAGSSSSSSSGGTSLNGGSTSGSTSSGTGGNGPTLALKGKITRATVLKNFAAVKGAGAITYKVAGVCKMMGSNIVSIGKKGNCKIMITQASKGKIKGKKATVNVTVG